MWVTTHHKKRREPLPKRFWISVASHKRNVVALSLVINGDPDLLRLVRCWHRADVPSGMEEFPVPSAKQSFAGPANWSQPDPNRTCQTSSLDHLVGAREDGGRDRKTERTCGAQVDHHLEGGRLLDRQVGRLGPFRILWTKVAARRNRSSKFVPNDLSPPAVPYSLKGSGPRTQ